MAWVYILEGSCGRHYIGSTVDLEATLAQHLRGHTYTTQRLGTLKVAAKRECPISIHGQTCGAFTPAFGSGRQQDPIGDSVAPWIQSWQPMQF